MEKLISNKRRLIGGGLLLGFITLAAAGCGPNTSGDGNEFIVDGTAIAPGNQSIEVYIYDIKEADGEAKGWFNDDKVHQIHDNCNCHGFWSGNEQYGHIYGLAGQQITASQVVKGDCIEFTGKIRSNQEGKTYDDRPVYNIAQEIHC